MVLFKLIAIPVLFIIDLIVLRLFLNFKGKRFGKSLKVFTLLLLIDSGYLSFLVVWNNGQSYLLYICLGLVLYCVFILWLVSKKSRELVTRR